MSSTTSSACSLGIENYSELIHLILARFPRFKLALSRAIIKKLRLVRTAPVLPGTVKARKL